MSRKPKPVEVANLTALRDQLFETGSSFAKVERSQIVGIDSLVAQLDETVNWLVHPEWFAKHGSRLEPGILLTGEPGTGKTMLARYLATCSNALFLSVRDWPVAGEMVAAADVGDLFRRAREYYAREKRPILIFWDELEIYAKRRSESAARDASVVSQLMSELDGVNGKCSGILFVGCTNYPNVIDPALKRHGRLGKQFESKAPDRSGKMLLLRYYLSRHASIENLDLESASYFLPKEASAATIEEACERVWRKVLGVALDNGAALEITQEVLNDILLDELLGPLPPFSEFSSDVYRQVALHELGHALVAKTLEVAIQVLTIRAGSDTFGRVLTVSDEELGFCNAEQLRQQITVALGALAMEQFLGLDVSTGVEGDVKGATRMVILLVEKLAQHSWKQGRGWVGPVSVHALEARSPYVELPLPSPALLEYFDREESGILRECYDNAYRILAGIGREAIGVFADRFVQSKTWTGKQFDLVFSEVTEGRMKAVDRRHVADLLPVS